MMGPAMHTADETFDLIDELLDHARTLIRERPGGLGHGDAVLVGKKVRELKRQTKQLRAFADVGGE
jgi:hypothetical protein